MASYKKHLVLNATAFCGSTDQRFQTILGGFVDRLIVHFHLSARVDGSTKAISILRRNSHKKARQHSARRVVGMGSEGKRMCRQSKKKSDIRGVDKDYEAHTAANKNGFRGGGEAENRDIVRRREFLEDAWRMGESIVGANDKRPAFSA